MRSAFFALLMIGCGSSGVAAEPPNPLLDIEPRLRIVFFTPKDVDPPEGVRERMKDVIDYGQEFYSKWLEHWGYEPENVLPVDRDENGLPIVYFVRGGRTAASGAYDDVGFQFKVREAAAKQNNIPMEGSTWWVFVYGTPLKASRGWGSEGDKTSDGLALLVWHDDPGELTVDMPMCHGLADTINLKGYLHELGHTMNLAHFGPLDKHGLGMSLMGPNARTYRRARGNREENVYLTPVVAALIWKHQLMTGRYVAEMKKPEIEVRNFSAVYERSRSRFVLKGRLVSDQTAHSVIAIDTPDEGRSTYWKKGHAARLDENGDFQLVVDELLPTNGKFLVLFCFNDGYITGKGTGYGYKHAAEIPYTYQGGNYAVGEAGR